MPQPVPAFHELRDSCVVYLDDKIVYSLTFEQHLERLAAVFNRLSVANLKVKASKCQLFRDEVHFFGASFRNQALPLIRRK
jgi:hypothetical protein